MKMNPGDMGLIGLVGPCGAGKSTISTALRGLGYRAKPIAQEHSYAPEMWRKITNPAILIFLDASHPVTVARRNLDWREADWQEQHHRLRHARQHADFYLLTDGLTVEQSVMQIVEFLENIALVG